MRPICSTRSVSGLAIWVVGRLESTARNAGASTKVRLSELTHRPSTRDLRQVVKLSPGPRTVTTTSMAPSSPFRASATPKTTNSAPVKLDVIRTWGCETDTTSRSARAGITANALSRTRSAAPLHVFTAAPPE